MRSLLVVAFLLVVAAPASAETASVSIPGTYFSPSSLTVVVGDTVTWRNADLRSHDVAGGSFASGALGRFGSFTTRFDAPGAFPYVCSIHPFMQGSVSAVPALLRSPGAVLAGSVVRLSGRAAGGASVALEHHMPDGSWHRLGSVAAGGDGAFSFSVIAAAGDVYRAATAAGASPEVGLAVTSEVTARVTVRGGSVHVRTTPAHPGLVATLQRYSRERFMWRRAAHERLDRRGRASFRARRRGLVRVIVARGRRGAPLTTSDVVRLPSGRRARDPMAPRDNDHGSPPPDHDAPDHDDH